MQQKSKFSVCLCLALLLAVCIGLFTNALPAKVSAENGSVSASYVKQTNHLKNDWRGNYGKNGYIVMSGSSDAGTTKGKYFYSDMYGAENVGKALTATTNNGYVDGTIAENASIKKWGVTSEVYHWSDDLKNSALLTPDGNYTGLRLEQNTSNTTDRSVSLLINTACDETYLTVYVYSNSKNRGGKIGVCIYNSAITDKKTNDNGADKTVDEYYGGSPLAHATVFLNNATESNYVAGNFVTFKLSGSGDYQVVVYREDIQGETGSGSDLKPSIGGFFFDSEITDEKAEFVDSSDSLEQAWQGNYGSDGYIVFGGKDSKPYVYSDMYQDGTYSNGFTPVFDGFEVSDKSFKDDAVISTWGYTSAVWMNRTDSSLSKTLYTPGTTDDALLRFENTKCDDKSVSVFFTVNKATYVSVYVYSESKLVTGDIGVYVYHANGVKNKETSDSLDEYYDFGMQPLAQTAVTVNGYGVAESLPGYFVTFRLESEGSYRIVAARANISGEKYSGTTAREIKPGIGGIFFDGNLPYIDGLGIQDISLTLDGTIGLNFYATIDGEVLNNKNLTVELEYGNGVTESLAIPSKEIDGTYKFTAKVVAKNYASDITLKFFTNSEQIGGGYTMSVKGFCDKVAADDAISAKLKKLCAALDNYCARAAEYFAGEAVTVTESMSAVSAETLSQYKFIVEGDSGNIDSVSLMLESETSLCLYVQGSDIVTVDGQIYTPETLADGKKVIVISDIAAKSLSEKHTIVVGDCTITASALSYAYAALTVDSKDDTKSVMKALYLYNVAAVEYFN